MAGMAGVMNTTANASAANWAAAASYAIHHPFNLSPNSFLGKAATALSGAAANTVPGNASVIGAEETEKQKATQFNGCATCRARKYVDVSSESDVSFQSAAHIDPAASASVVSSHEREHVANAVQKASKPGARLVSASVRLITSVCPECGRRYVAGGVTNTLIRYTKNPYSQNHKQVNDGLLRGNKVDFTL